jgi:hypothetical protein
LPSGTYSRNEELVEHLKISAVHHINILAIRKKLYDLLRK